MHRSGKVLTHLAATALGIYLICDGVARGPVLRWVMLWSATTRAAETHTADLVARVYGHPITRSQLARAVCERLWLEGKSEKSLTPEDRNAVRNAALDDLIDHELLRAKAGADDPRFAVSDAELDERLKRFGRRFESSAVMLAALESQGIGGERELRAMLAARLRQEKYVESRIGPLAVVTEAEARQWVDANRQTLAIPERVEARHVFIATLEHPPEEARAKLAVALADLTAKRKDIATLARELSEDPATSESGGSLGWMTRERLPADFTGPVFALELHQPTLVQTHLGWHLIEVTGRKPAEPRTFDQAKPEIIAALESIHRQSAVSEFRAALRRLEAPHIEIFPELVSLLPRPPDCRTPSG